MGDTTNDEAANYGKRPRVIETLDKLTRQYEDAKYGEGFVRTLVDSLKVTDEQCMEYFTNEMEKKYGKEGEQPKREPMLSNNEIYDESYRADLVQPDSYGDGWDSPNSEANWALGAKWTRERYESLIDKGVLITKADADKMVEAAVEKALKELHEDNAFDAEPRD